MNASPLALAALLALAPLASAQTVHDVTTSGLDFVPANITIEVGDTVRWTMGGTFHTVTDEPNLGPPLFDAALPLAGQVFEFTFDQAAIDTSPRPGGVYNYVCTPHQVFNMVGSVTVAGIPLVADNLIVSASGGSTINLDLDAGPANAGKLHLLLGSGTGTSPGIPLDPGVVLPLNFDAYLNITLANANTPVFTSTFGLLDVNGQAACSVNIPSGQNPNLVGQSFDHAFAVIDPGVGFPFGSNPVPMFIGF